MLGRLWRHPRSGERRPSGDAFQSQIMWLFGSPRSGSTWLLRMLADHPNVVGINEPHIGYYLGPFLSDLPGADPSRLDVHTFTLRRIQKDSGHQLFAESYRDAWAPALAKLMEDRFYAQARRHPRAVPFEESVVVVKEPNGSQSADIIMSTQPEARLMFLLRDGRDVVDSELAANEAGSWVSSEFPGIKGIAEVDRLPFVIQSAHKWLWRTQVVQEAFDAHRGPKYLVRYEDLRAEPYSQMRSILDWLGLSLSDQDLHDLVGKNQFERIPVHMRGRKSFYRTAMPGLWKENLTTEENTAVHGVLAAKLAELGYPVRDV